MDDVLVLGGGFGGLAAASELRQLLDDDARITLIARDDRFAMGFAKLWDLAGLRPLGDGTRALADLEGQGVGFRHADITRIDPVGHQVETDQGVFEADGLVVALGAGPTPEHRALLQGPRAHDLYDPAHLPAIHRDLEAVTDGRVVVAILGGPFTCPPAPYEAALIVDQRLRGLGVRDAVDVTLVTPQPMSLPAAGPDASRYVADHLAEHGVELRAGQRVVAVDGSGRRLQLADGDELDYELLLGVCAASPPPVVAGSHLAAPDGWIHPDPHTLRTDFERVYAVGDCTTIATATGQLPRAGVFAAAEATVAARNLASDLGVGDGDRFDGHGYCFLELPGERVAYVEGDFYADPPQVTITPADHEQFTRKQAYERDHLAAWLG